MINLSFSNSLKRGFTLVELLIVIGVLGVMAGVAISIINPVAQFQKANDSKRKSDLAQIQRALEIYYQDLKSYPLNSSAYKIKDSTGTELNWGNPWTPYMGNLPADPNSPAKNYAYISDGQTYYLYASLDRGTNDSQVCQNLNSNGECPSVPVANLCGGKCNYGVSSPNVSP